jgi:N-acetylmuramoyl-L-alanine amidase
MKNLTYLLILLLLSGCQGERGQGYYHEMAYLSPDQALKQYKNNLIVVDAGHGGTDMGTRSLMAPYYQEKSLNLSTAYFLKDFLQKSGYQVMMTRRDDTFISLPTRSMITNNYNPALFVSVHYNAAQSEKADGIEVYYYDSSEDKQRSKSSKRLAELVLKEVIQKTGAKSRGVKHGNLAVLREAKVPAILVEGGFMTNKTEMEKIKDPSYIKQLSYGIALGVEQYLNNSD